MEPEVVAAQAPQEQLEVEQAEVLGEMVFLHPLLVRR
jgi:hypothetical protein